MQYAVIIEGGGKGYSAYSPDIPGCGAAAASEDEVRRLIREALEFHLEGLALSGYPIPQPTSSCEMMDITLPRAQPAAAE